MKNLFLKGSKMTASEQQKKSVERFALGFMEKEAQKVKEFLAPHCERIEIAGSIRRKKPQIKDIEIVCIPKKIVAGLFYDETIVHPAFIEAVNRLPKIKGEPTGKYTQRTWRALAPNIFSISHGGPDFIGVCINVDIFIATPENWGLIYALRTGPADFAHYKILKAVSESGYFMRDGYLRRTEAGPQFCDLAPVPEEEIFFAKIGLPWIEPEERI